MAEYIEREAALKAIAEDKIEMTPELIAIGRAIGTYTAEQAFDGINQACDRHIESIKILPAADVQPVKWIPVTERLPDFEGMCLCMRKSYSKANFRHQEIMYFDYDGQGFFSNVEGIFVADGNVTHWMPLPEPPEEEDGGVY